MVYGGRSGEHEVSLRSAEAVMAALDRERFEVLPFLISKEGVWQPHPIVPQPGANPGIDVVFPVLHGTFGEDGTVQGLMELAGLPYVGAGVLGSAVSMDKELTKRVCRERGIPVVEYVSLRADGLDPKRVLDELPLPVFVKPANLGSSVGISKARTEEELAAALELAARYDRKILVERAVTGRELECAVLGNDDPKASLPCEVHPSREFYDYDDKYLLDAAEFDMPAKLTPEETTEVQRLAVTAFRATGCEGMARVDFLSETATGRIYINEVNTIPGFTSISMYPKMWQHSGISFPSLVERLIELALERGRTRGKLRYSR